MPATTLNGQCYINAMEKFVSFFSVIETLGCRLHYWYVFCIKNTKGNDLSLYLKIKLKHHKINTWLF